MTITERINLSKAEQFNLISALMKNLAPLRVKVGVSQGELASLVGISRQTYSAIETGKKIMSWSTYLSLILFFDYNRATHELLRSTGAFPAQLVSHFNAGRRRGFSLCHALTAEAEEHMDDYDFLESGDDEESQSAEEAVYHVLSPVEVKKPAISADQDKSNMGNNEADEFKKEAEQKRMDEKMFEDLRLNETDVEGALYRLSGDEALYNLLLSSFLNDPTLSELKVAIEQQDWDEAFTAAHALKGLAGNLGFTPLFHSIGELVIFIRSGKLDAIENAYEKVWRNYTDITSAIRNCLMSA